MQAQSLHEALHASEALPLLRTVTADTALLYCCYTCRHIDIPWYVMPVLMVQVDAWMAVQPPLDPRRLLPALLRWGEIGAPASARAQALRYVQFCIARLASADTALHNLAVSRCMAVITGEFSAHLVRTVSFFWLAAAIAACKLSISIAGPDCGTAC